jgi:hypothetical protein
VVQIELIKTKSKGPSQFSQNIDTWLCPNKHHGALENLTVPHLFKKLSFYEIRRFITLKSIIFWDITPCSPLSANRRFWGTYRLHLQGRRYNFSKKPATKQVVLKMEAICSSETSVDTQRTTRHYIPEDYTLHNYLVHESLLLDPIVSHLNPMHTFTSYFYQIIFNVNFHSARWCCGNALVSCSGGTRFESRPGYWLPWLGFLCSFSVPPSKCRDSTASIQILPNSSFICLTIPVSIPTS